MDGERLIMAPRLDIKNINKSLYTHCELIAFSIDQHGNYSAIPSLAVKPDIITLYAVGPNKKTALRDYEIGRSLRNSIDHAIVDATKVSAELEIPLYPKFNF